MGVIGYQHRDPWGCFAAQEGSAKEMISHPLSRSMRVVVRGGVPVRRWRDGSVCGLISYRGLLKWREWACDVLGRFGEEAAEVGS